MKPLVAAVGARAKHENGLSHSADFQAQSDLDIWGWVTAVWGNEGGDKTMLKQLVYRLRSKLEETGTAVQIETIPGVGYSLRQE